MTILGILLTLLVWGIIFYVLWWAWNAIALPEPFFKVGQVVLVVAAVIVLIGIFTGSIAPFPFLTTIR